MQLQMPGSNISEIEVSNISIHGLWLYVKGKEYFLPYTEFPWFKEATVSKIVNVEWFPGDHLYWPDLDVDLTVDSLEHPEKYPLVSN